MKRKKKNKDWKYGGLWYAAQQVNIEENEIDAAPWWSAQSGAKDAQERWNQSFLDKCDEEGNKMNEVQGAKTGAVMSNDELQIHCWNGRTKKLKNWKQFWIDAS